MRASWKVLAALLLVSGALVSIKVDAMDGSGSPWHFQSCPYPPAACGPVPPTGVPAGSPGTFGGHHNALFQPATNPAPGYSVFYPASSNIVPANCYNSPRQMAYEPSCTAPNFGISSPFYGMGPPSQRQQPTPVSGFTPRGAWQYRTIQPCNPAGVTPIVGFPGDPTERDPGPLRRLWTPIESIQNAHAPVNKYVADNSVAYTPFQKAGTPGYTGPAGSPGYSYNPHNDPYVFGTGRFHLDDEQVVQFVGTQANQSLPLTSDGDPDDVEGAPDNRFVILGDDGYILGRFASPVMDLPGYDIIVNAVLPNGSAGPVIPTFCMYGATSPQGPFFLVHSAFNNGAECDTTNQTTAYCPWVPSSADDCPSVGTLQLYCWNFDLDFFYSRLRRGCAPTCTGGAPADRLDYFLIVNSLDRTPYLKADFTAFPLESANFCINLALPRYGIQPNQAPGYPNCPSLPSGLPPTYPQVSREVGETVVEAAHYHFMSTAVRFGFPMYQIGPAPFPDNVADTSADPISEWNWDFSSDPYAIPPMYDAFPDPYVTVNPPSRGKPDTVWPMGYVPPATFEPTPPRELWTYQRKMTSVSGPADPLNSPTHAADHNRSHRFVSTGLFPVCHSVHTTVDQILPSNGRIFMAHWRQSDPPYSDPWPGGPGGGPIDVTAPLPPVEHHIPHPSQMFCKPMAVWNIPPIAAFSYLPEWGSPRKFTFYSEASDVDWVPPVAEDPNTGLLVRSGKTHPNPYYDHYHAPLCWDCPPDGISVRQWDFVNDGLSTAGSYGGKCMPVLPAPNCNTFTTQQGDVSWRFLSRKIFPAYSHDPTIAFNGTAGCNAWPDPSFCNQFFTCNSPVQGDYDWRYILHTTSPAFSLEDVGARVSGFGIPEDTRIVAYLSNRCVQVNNQLPPSYVSQKTPAVPPFTMNYWPLTVAISWPYNETRDSPTHEYPGPGNYPVRMTVCDKEYRVNKTRLQGNNHWGQLSSVQGDVLDVVWGTAASSTVPPWAPPTVPPTGTQINLLADTAPPNHQGKSLHACHSVVRVVGIENQPPLLATPPNFVVRAGQPVEFMVRGSDVDPNQVLTLRLCLEQPELPNPAVFPTASSPGPAHHLNRTFRWDTSGLGPGVYGPICFEVTDGLDTIRTETRVYLVLETSDSDGDGVADLGDNCPGTPNADQRDADRDGLGDACHSDRVVRRVARPPIPSFPEGVVDQDADGVPDERDNCVSLANRDQSDRDGDGMGDICDIDADGDHVMNQDDNCPLVPNRTQLDLNGDGAGDDCPGVQGAERHLLDGVSVQESAPPAKAEDATWRTILGFGLGILAMMVVLVPLLMFALRRTKGGEGDDGAPPS